VPPMSIPVIKPIADEIVPEPDERIPAMMHHF
jgi:hypothetical protein